MKAWLCSAMHISTMPTFSQWEKVPNEVRRMRGYDRALIAAF
jgi:hypothetical protein